MGVTDLLLLSCLGFAITAHAQNCSVPDGGPTMHLKDEYILKQTFASGDRAAFTCATGHHSEGGSSSITCTAGSWSTVRLKCERNSCGSPGEVEKGQIHYPKENLFGDHIEITCNDGYRLVGKSRITCGAQGWLDRLPRCEVLTCNPPPLVSDSTFTPHKDSYNFEDVVRYSCGGGLTLNGSASISCSRDGTFQPAPPTCTKVECKDLDILHADWISGSRPPHGHKATVEYKCRKGFKMVGQSTLICEINSQWSPEPPRCDMVTCDRPPLVSNATFTPHKDSYNFAEVVRYSCEAGLTLSGSASASCSDDGTFQPAPPTCIKVECKDLDILHADWISGSRPPHGHKATVEYKCRNGFKMVGQSTLICEINSQWSPEPPRCDVQNCSVPDGGPNMHLKDEYILKQTFASGDRAAFTCATGYNPTGGSSSITCTAGSWSTVGLKCERINCGRPRVENGQIHFPKETFYGDHIVITCNDGYRLDGKSQITCGAQGWMDRLPKCEAVYCEEPHVKHGHLTNDARPPYRPNDKVTYACSSFYNMEGEPTLTCKADGQWSSPPPTCAGSIIGPVLGIIVAIVAIVLVVLAWYYGFLPCFRKKNGNVDHSILDFCCGNHLVEENPPKPEEEVALSEGVSLKECPTSNGQALGGTVDESPVMSKDNV